MLLSLTEKQVATIKHALDELIERYEDNRITAEEEREYEQATTWELKAYECRKILEKL